MPVRLITRLPCLVCLLTPLTARPAEPAQWNYSTKEGNGSFRHIDGKAWVELHPNGARPTFEEVDRTAEYVELYDSGRGHWVRLYPTKSTWRHPDLTSNQWRDLWPGAYRAEWVEWTYRTDNGEGFFRHDSNQDWFEMRPDGKRYSYKEVDRTTQYVELYHGDTGKVWTRLYPTKATQRTGDRSGAFPLLYSGHFRTDSHVRLKFCYLEVDDSPAIFVARPTSWISFTQGNEYRLRLIEKQADGFLLVDDNRRITVKLFLDGRCRWKSADKDWRDLGKGRGDWGLQELTKK